MTTPKAAIGILILVTIIGSLWISLRLESSSAPSNPHILDWPNYPNAEQVKVTNCTANFVTRDPLEVVVEFYKRIIGAREDKNYYKYAEQVLGKKIPYEGIILVVRKRPSGNIHVTEASNGNTTNVEIGAGNCEEGGLIP